MSHPAPTIPTLADMEARFYARIDTELEHYAGKLAKRAFRAAFHDVLSGDVALLSREDREQALETAFAAGNRTSHNRPLALSYIDDARRLLQLDPGPEE